MCFCVVGEHWPVILIRGMAVELELSNETFASIRAPIETVRKIHVSVSQVGV